MPALLRLREVLMMGGFLHQGTDELGIPPGSAPHGCVVRVPWFSIYRSAALTELTRDRGASPYMNIDKGLLV